MYEAATRAEPPSIPVIQGPAALAVEDLSHSFGTREALDRVSFTIPPAGFTMLLGLNGAGKTTLFSLITRLYSNRTGAIRIFGFDLRRQPTRALERIGVVFQQPTLDLDLSVLQNLRYHGGLHGMRPADCEARAREELARIGLADRANDKVRALSGGQRRRVELARALLHRPSLLLLDEPTVGLDVESRRDILRHVRALCRDQGLAVLWATHLMDEADADDAVVVLHQGRLCASGGVRAVCAATGASSLPDAFRALTTRDAGPHEPKPQEPRR
ncbi:ABC transporter ATP-binding protein [Azospirillum sp. TSO35-2]|uniref:ABC transporter ATP-binding protein n=1 Tax=Azospirillum sp. TSO35-2 TaxID=716796 RepID=UPI000D60510C|nr:ABC transporter ATP-binding protein [Azospirillum sp. TSO35-2]PWC37863.1 ABC transporter ATP-binding protein [Azospirillum sp. TSO35-2]